MTRISSLKITFIALFISMLIEAATGLAMLCGALMSHPKIFRLVFNTHKYNGIVFVFLIILHLVQNWPWVRHNFFKSKEGAPRNAEK